MTGVPDKRLERYELVDRIAVGGMAEVFRATAFGAHGFEKQLAIKKILPRLANDAEFEERFIREAKLAVQLAHANIVQVFDFGRLGGTLFFAMEYVDGLDLAHLLEATRERGELIPVGAALHIAIELLKGLDYAHQRGVVHRDVSPSNVLLSQAGEVKIADFGIAHFERDHLPTDRHRRVMGKVRYMSPEQTRGDNLSTRADLFSAAVVMYELMTGQKLFGGDDAQQIIDNIHEMTIPPVSTIRAELPDQLDEVLLQALLRDPNARPSHAVQLQRALTDVSYDTGIVASALEVAEVVTGVMGMHPAASASTRSKQRDIDEWICAQLESVDGTNRPGITESMALEHHDVDRRTEVMTLKTQAMLVRTGVDARGVATWEHDGELRTTGEVPPVLRGKGYRVAVRGMLGRLRSCGAQSGPVVAMGERTHDVSGAVHEYWRWFALVGALLLAGGAAALLLLDF